jgi:TatD DNase family protein
LTYIDAHLHVADPGYAGQVDLIIQDSSKNNVSHLLSNAVDHETSLETISLAKRHESLILAAIGVHPSIATKISDCKLDNFEKLLQENGNDVRAIGEIGLDGTYTQDPDRKKRQEETFQFFLRLAERHELPVIIHSRSAVEPVLSALASFHLQRVLLHWFDGNMDQLKVSGEHGYQISFGPALLYSHRLQELARAADIRTILTETDGPVRYRGAPFEGKVTMPSFVIHVVRKIAEIKSMSTEAVEDAVRENFEGFLGSRPSGV